MYLYNDLAEKNSVILHIYIPHLHFMDLIPSEFWNAVVYKKTRMSRVAVSERISTVRLAVLAQTGV